MSAPLLSIHNLRTYFYSRSKRAFIRSVDGVSLSINQGETLGVVGESGCGKSVTALSVMGLITAAPGVIQGRIDFDNGKIQRNLLEGVDRQVRLTEENGRIMGVVKEKGRWQRQSDQLQKGIRGGEIAMIFQNPKSSMNPYEPVGEQIVEAVRLHTPHKGKKEAEERAMQWLERVRIDSPRLRFHNHPFGLSGGMCQRAMIAMALAAEPSLLIADEPTTGLDATIQSKIVDLLAELKGEIGITTMLISHDMGVIGRLSDRVAVMYGGRVVEEGPAPLVLAGGEGNHPYTRALIASIPGEEEVRQKSYLQAIDGDVLDTINIPAGCRFYSRCNRVTDAVRERCAGCEPELMETANGQRVRCWLFAK
jgi:oligopeptide/dipeptide ABC transporter ATP-binding protein